MLCFFHTQFLFFLLHKITASLPKRCHMRLMRTQLTAYPLLSSAHMRVSLKRCIPWTHELLSTGRRALVSSGLHASVCCISTTSIFLLYVLLFLLLSFLLHCKEWLARRFLWLLLSDNISISPSTHKKKHCYCVISQLQLCHQVSKNCNSANTLTYAFHAHWTHVISASQQRTRDRVLKTL